MIFRLEYKNRNGLQARLDITTPGSSIVKEIEGTEQPFLLSYKGDKSDKSLNFLTSSAEINIYETPEFNIDALKTSNETQIKVDYYIGGSLYWTGFVIPDFFSREIGGAGVVSMVASDRISTLKGVTLSDLPAMVQIRDLAVQCLAKTGLSLPLKTMADFQHGSTANGFFTSKVISQRLTDNKGRSISCYDILKSILVASNSRLEQQGAEWRITNKLQHELGTGRLYSSSSAFTNYLESVFNFSEITKGAMRSIVPVAGSVGIFHEHGGGKLHPDNYDFSQGLTGWSPVGGFSASTDNREIKEYKVLGGIYTPQYGEVTGKNYLVNANAYQRNTNPIYFESEAISVPYSGAGSINVDFDINGVGPMTYPNASKTVLRVAIIAEKGSELLTLHHGGKFGSMPSTNPPVFEKRFEAGFVNEDLTTQADTKSMRVSGTLELDELDGWNIKVRIYGSGSSTPVMINAASVQMKSSQDIPKGVILKSEQGADFTKAHDIETTIFGDYLTKGLNGYFYDYPIDDTSSLYIGNVLTLVWKTPFVAGETGEFNLLHHSVRQMRRAFSVAHDLISGEIEMDKFNPLSIFVDCNGNRYVVVSAEFDFLRSNVKIELEEIAYANLTVRDYIYSYFGDGESGISSVGGIQAGSGGGGGSGMTADQVAILNNLASWWKLDDDGNLFTGLNVYSEKEVSAYGIGSGGSGGGGSNVIWGTQYTTQSIELTVEGTKKILSLSSHTHDVYGITGLVNALNNKQDKLTAGSGITISGNTISATGGGGGSNVSWGTTSNNYSPLTVEGTTKTVALSGHTHAWGDVTGKPTTISGYGITDAYTKVESDSKYALNTRTISAGAGLTGGGNLTTNRTLALDTVYTDNRYYGYTDSAINDLEIGGRNTYSNSTQLGSYRLSVSSRNIGDTVNGFKITPRDPYTDNRLRLINVITSTGWWTVSFEVRSDTATGIRVDINDRSDQIQGVDRTISSEWQKITCTVNDVRYTQSLYNFVDIGVSPMDGPYDVEIRNIKIEKGNKATDWTPAPEDVQAEIDLKAPIKNPVFTGTVTAPTFIGALSGNASTATTLQTARNIWGRPFNGTANITGAMTGVTSIAMSAALTGATILNASQNINTPKVSLGSNWTIEQSGIELQFKYGGVIKQRLFQDGSFAATGEVAAYSQGVAADTLDLLRLNLNQGGGDAKYLSSTATQIYFNIGGATPLSMTKTEVRRGTTDNSVSLGTSAYPWANIYGVNLTASTNLTTPKITLGNGWTIEQTSASLTIRRNGVVKGTFNA